MNAFFGTSIDITQRAHCIWPVGLQLLAQSVVTRFSCLFSPRRYSSRERSSSFVTSWFTERKKKSIELRKKNVKTESKIPISTNLRSYLNKNSTRNKGRIQVIVLDDQGWRRRGRSSFYADGYAEVRFSVRSKLCEEGENKFLDHETRACAPHFLSCAFGRGAGAMVNHQSRVLSAFPSSSFHRKRSHPFFAFDTIAAASWWTKILHGSANVRALRTPSGSFLG